MKLRLAVILISVLSFAFADENGFDTLNLVKGKSNYIKVNTVIQPNDDLDLDDFNQEVNFDFQEYNVDSSYRFFFNENFSLDAGFEARHYNLFIDVFNVDIDAYLLDANFAFNFLLTPQFLLNFVLSPGIHSDFDGFDHRHLYIDGSMEAAFLLSKSWLFQPVLNYILVPMDGDYCHFLVCSGIHVTCFFSIYLLLLVPRLHLMLPIN